MQDLGERIASLTASFNAEREYQHDRWHKLDNDLTPVVNLPERLTREIGKLHGLVDGKIQSVSKELERSMEVAIKKACEPLSERVGNLESEVESLKIASSKLTGAKLFGAWLLSTVLAIAAVFGIGHAK